jgi:ribosome biogenesis GTPase
MNLNELGWNLFFEQALPGIPGAPARIAGVHRTRYDAWCEDGERSVTLAGRLRHDAESPADLPQVGDWVWIDGDDVIQDVLPRMSCLSRRQSGSGGDQQVIATNLDTVFVVTGLDDNFNPRRIERMCVLVEESGAIPVVLLNKADLDTDRTAADEALRNLIAPIFFVSALTGDGLEHLDPYVRTGQTVALIGSSGVGKSSLTNRLLGDAVQDIQDVRTGDSKGRHTTTSRDMLRIPGRGILIDTPGMRDFQLWADEDAVAETFADIESIAAECRFRDCSHDGEPGCAVRAALDDGRLDAERIANWDKMKREARYLERKDTNSKKRWKSISQALRKRNL